MSNTITDLIEGGVQFARTAERLGAVLNSVTVVREGIERVVVLEPELKPEMITALEHLSEVVETLGRAGTFIDARFQAQLGER